MSPKLGPFVKDFKETMLQYAILANRLKPANRLSQPSSWCWLSEFGNLANQLHLQGFTTVIRQIYLANLQGGAIIYQGRCKDKEEVTLSLG